MLISNELGPGLCRPYRCFLRPWLLTPSDSSPSSELWPSIVSCTPNSCDNTMDRHHRARIDPTLAPNQGQHLYPSPHIIPTLINVQQNQHRPHANRKMGDGGGRHTVRKVCLLVAVLVFGHLMDNGTRGSSMEKKYASWYPVVYRNCRELCEFFVSWRPCEVMNVSWC